MNSTMPRSTPAHELPSATPGESSHAGLATRHLVRSGPTRVIHLLLLVVVVNQLASSQFIERPLPGEPPGWPYALHQYVGLASVAVVAAFWVWAMVRRGETRLARLVPWFSVTRVRDVAADLSTQLRRMVRGKAPDDNDGAFASAVHGLGLLTVTAMAVSGAVYFLAQGTPVARTSMGLHKLFANLMWAYLFGHVGVAAFHHLLGSDVFSRMFWSGRGLRAPRRADSDAR